MNPLIEMSLWWMLVLAATIIMHYVNIKVWKSSPLHWLNFTILVFMAIVVSCIFFDTWKFRALSTLYLGFLHWTLFSPILNKARGFDLVYLGEDGDPEEDSMFDKWERAFRNPGMLLGLKATITIMLSFILLDL